MDEDIDKKVIASPMVVLVEIAKEASELEETLRSLREKGLAVLQVGSPEVPTLADAAKLINWDGQPWLMPIAAGDTLAPGAVGAYQKAIENAEGVTKVIYADDDLIDGKGRAHTPHFKPDWNGELFRHFDYLTGACLLRANREDLEAVSAKTDWASSLTAALVEEAKPLHLCRMLHHRRSRPMPRLPAMPKIVEENLPPVTIIVPTRNRVDLLRTCIEGVAATDYPDIEVIIVDNDSDDPETLDYLSLLDPRRHRTLHHCGAFNFSAINNRAVVEANGKLVCLLNNDIEIITPDWLKTMVVQAQRDHVGAVGAQLLYPDGRIQHAGVAIGMGNAAGHAHRFVRPNEEGYFFRHALPHFTTAVTAACLVVERERFLAVGGLDEENFPVAFNDVDLCMRLNQKGWQSFYEPRAKLIHHESLSRGLDRDPVGAARFEKELAALQRLWRTDEVTDPHHHPQLSRVSEQFVVRL
ncbi:glycosyltransferase family 2 protein [Sphingobium subterraneum]|uniref:GT2 family glycosyltransferase n=1 Tax=Sphingobium subterraneum TaxID=627688 RepID=A0A841IZB6_9SPHN|nr:GT2 family glycosyltransferase [Sphingobium subterraneum]